MKNLYKGKYPHTLMEAAAAHSLLGTLGYSEDDMRLAFVSDKTVVRLKIEDNKLNFVMGPSELSKPKMIKKWKNLLEDWNTGGIISDKEKDDICDSSDIWKKRNKVVADLKTNGFDIPTPLEDE